MGGDVEVVYPEKGLMDALDALKSSVENGNFKVKMQGGKCSLKLTHYISKTNPKFEKQMQPCKSTAKEVSFEWSHHRISSTGSRVRAMPHVSMTDSGSESVNWGYSVL